MLFNSVPFVLLVILTLVLYYRRTLRKYQVHILIAASFAFYAWGQPILLILLVASGSINAATSYLIFSSNEIWKKKTYAISGVAFNLAVLMFFKYSPLFGQLIENIASAKAVSEVLLLIPLPVGISFYTFQGISLVVDMYRADGLHSHRPFYYNETFKKHYLNTIFFISFFPQLVAGPIVKAHQFYPQIKAKYLGEVDFANAYKIILTGYFLKIVVADNLNDQTFWMTYPFFESLSTATLLMLLFGYSIQIFSDFAGYSLIAIGAAKLFGYDLPQNFNFPYVSRSFSEFWTRWHISLSTWLKEYLYFSLGGNRRGHVRTYINLMVVMLLGGLWHGAAWSYMVWGGYHGLLLVTERLIGRWFAFPASAFWNIVKAIWVFTLVSVGWLLFKLPEFGQALKYIESVFSNGNMPHRVDVVAMIAIYSLPVLAYYGNYVLKSHFKTNLLDSSVIYAGMMFAVFVNSGRSSAFIYFQF